MSIYRTVGLRRIGGLLGIASLALALQPAWAQVFLPHMGGGGGGQYRDLCPQGTNLTGVELRAGDDVDAIRPVCSVSFGKAALGASSASPTWHGGPGGKVELLNCPASAPVVSGLGIQSEGVDTIIVNSVRLFCSAPGSGQPPNPNPGAIFEGPAYVPSKSPIGIGVGGDLAHGATQKQDCPEGQVAVGVHGRSGKWLDAVGLVCDLPRITAAAGVPSIGRVAISGAPGAPPPSICEAAQAARARNSPAAANLEARCRAQTPVVSSIGRAPQTAGADGSPVSICDRAAAARDRKSPAAANLAAQCQSLGGRVPDPAPGGQANEEDLIATGQAMASANPLAAELRQRQAPGLLRDGFDIGLAVTGADTAWGPGKQKMLDALSPPRQEGFKLAVSLLMDQNRNAELAQIGLAIAEADPSVTAMRAREPDARFKLGFDIASGLFGNPALGSKGSTASGPGALKIRDSLSAPAQRGFTTSMQFHLSRRY